MYEKVGENIAIERGIYKIGKAFICNTNKFELYHESIQKTPKNSCWIDEWMNMQVRQEYF